MKPRTLGRLIQRARSIGPIDRGMSQNTVHAPHVVLRLNRALGVREIASAPTLGREIHPVVIVDDVSHDPGFDNRDAYWAARVVHTSAAGNGPFVIARNDSTDGIVVIDQIIVNASTTVEIHILRDNASYPGGTPAALMSRGEDPTTGSFTTRSRYLLCSGQDLAGATYVGVVRYRTGPATPFMNVNTALGPGQGLVVALQALTATLDCTFMYRERQRSQ